MAPSRSTAAVAQWVSLIPRTIIRDDDSSKHRADENPDVLGLADDQREGGGLDQERQSAGGGESRRHADALDQCTESDEEPCEGEQPEEEAPKHLDRGGRSLEVVGEHGQDGGIERKRRQKTGEPRTHRGSRAPPGGRAPRGIRRNANASARIAAGKSQTSVRATCWSAAVAAPNARQPDPRATRQ